MKSWIRWSFVLSFVVVLVGSGLLVGQEKKVVSVALRAYDSGEFVGDLAKDAVVVTEDGQACEVAALRTVLNNKVKKVDGIKGMKPAMNRNFILLYNINEYNSKIADTVDYFFEEVLKRGDQLILLTPLKPYTFSQQTLKGKSTEELIKAAKTVLKRDVAVGASTYLNVVEQMKQVVTEIKMGVDSTATGMGRSSTGSDMKSLLIQYRQLLDNMRQSRKINDGLLLKFADIFKAQPGQTHLVIFYHQELRPIPVRRTMSNLQKNKSLKFDAMDVFEADESKETMNVQMVGQTLVNSGIYTHLFYLTKPTGRDRRFAMKDNSQDVYGMLSKIADITGGVVETTAKAEAALKQVCAFCDNYYLVDFYSPAPQADGKFRTIGIEVKDRKVKTHYAKGYLAK